MTRQTLMRTGALVAIVSVIVGFGVWRFVEGHTDLDGDDPRPAAASSKSPQDDDGDIKISRDAQARSGIAVSIVQAGAMLDQTLAYATVLDPARLADLSNAETNAKAALEAASAKVEASSHAYERAKLLYKDDQNTSLAQLQAAEAAFRADQAAAAAARSQALTAQAAEASELGSALAGNLDHGGVRRALIDRRVLLVQVTASPGENPAATPLSAVLNTPNGGRVTARFVGLAPRADPKLQAMSYLFVAPAASGLLPGMNITALLPGGPSRRGAVVPGSAVVSWQGQSWIYQKTGPEQFRRVAVATDAPAVGGAYVTSAIAPGAAVVTRGAQLLLSQELKPQVQGAADED
jgi:hypothetical protein